MRILFFTPSCERSGTELYLHRIIQRLDRQKFQISVAYGYAGPLSNAFPADVTTFNYGKAVSLAERALDSFYHRAHRLLTGTALEMQSGVSDATVRSIHERVRPDLWCVNTVMQPDVLRAGRRLQVPCIVDAHELEGVMERLSVEDIDTLVTYPRLILAGSRAVAETMRVLGRTNNVEICHSAIDFAEINRHQQSASDVRKDLGIPSESFVWAMSGTRSVNKNPVRFVRIADRLLRQNEDDVRFLWIGGEDNGYSLYARRLAESLGMGDRVRWIPTRAEDYFDYLNAADGLVLTSTQEALSQAVLEAAALGKPIVSFPSEGPSEIVTDGVGVIVDSWNIEDIVEAMRGVMRRTVRLSESAARRRAAEFDIEANVTRWQQLVEQYAGAT